MAGLLGARRAIRLDATERDAQLAAPKFIDASDLDDMAEPGHVGFLVEEIHRGVSSWRLREAPLRTNMSHEPRLRGWCGETNNVSRVAHGVARVTEVLPIGRLRVVPVQAGDLAEALDALGFPELLPVDEGDDDEAPELDDDTPLCNCGTCSPRDITCVSRD